MNLGCFLLLLCTVSASTLLLTTGVFEHIDTDGFSKVDLSEYTDVIVAFDTAILNSDDARALIQFVESGGRLVLVGGSSSNTFLATLSKLISIETPFWRDVDAEISIWDEDCALTTFLQDTTIITNDHSFTIFGVPEDPFARVCLRDKFGVSAAVAKACGKGVVSYISLQPDRRFYQSSSSQTFLRHLLSNALLIFPHQAH
ncbi:hypothetical protein P9112_008702 [Eukaryota sp. TZLM1-RC]